MQMKSYLLFVYQYCRNVFFKQLPEHRRVLMTATHVMPILAGYLCGGKEMQVWTVEHNINNQNSYLGRYMKTLW